MEFTYSSGRLKSCHAWLDQEGRRRSCTQGVTSTLEKNSACSLHFRHRAFWGVTTSRADAGGMSSFRLRSQAESTKIQRREKHNKFRLQVRVPAGTKLEDEQWRPDGRSVYVSVHELENGDKSEKNRPKVLLTAPFWLIFHKSSQKHLFCMFFTEILWLTSLIFEITNQNTHTYAHTFLQVGSGFGRHHANTVFMHGQTQADYFTTHKRRNVRSFIWMDGWMQHKPKGSRWLLFCLQRQGQLGNCGTETKISVFICCPLHLNWAGCKVKMQMCVWKFVYVSNTHIQASVSCAMEPLWKGQPEGCSGQNFMYST